MSQDQSNVPSDHDAPAATALHRKVSNGRSERQARAMSLARALRLSIAKVADDVFDMAIATLSLRIEDVAGPDMIDIFDDKALLMLLDGPQRRRAAVVMDPLLVGALIQQQTMGQVLPDAGDDTRPMTNTDAAICAAFLNGILEQAGGMPEDDAERHLIEGFRFGARAEDARLLHLAMQAPLYQVIRLSLDVERGSRQGELVLCMPVPEPEQMEQAPDARHGQTDHYADAQKPSLAQSIPSLPIELRLVLSRLRMPLHAITAFKVGTKLTLMGAQFEEVEIQSLQGHKVGKGMLGQLQGTRAVQLRPKAASVDAPRRRANDRAELAQPVIEPIASPGREHLNTAVSPDNAALSPPDLSLPDRPDFPDMSDLPEFDDITLPEAQTG